MSRGAEMIAFIVGGLADLVWNSIRLAVGLLVLGSLCVALISFGLFAAVQIADNPPFEVVAKKW